MASIEASNMKSIDIPNGLQFNVAERLYSESGFEINKLLLGFGLSFFSYRNYNLTNAEDNIPFKFIF